MNTSFDKYVYEYVFHEIFDALNETQIDYDKKYLSKFISSVSLLQN